MSTEERAELELFLRQSLADMELTRRQIRNDLPMLVGVAVMMGGLFVAAPWFFSFPGVLCLMVVPGLSALLIGWVSIEDIKRLLSFRRRRADFEAQVAAELEAGTLLVRRVELASPFQVMVHYDDEHKAYPEGFGTVDGDEALLFSLYEERVPSWVEITYTRSGFRRVAFAADSVEPTTTYTVDSELWMPSEDVPYGACTYGVRPQWHTFFDPLSPPPA